MKDFSDTFVTNAKSKSVNQLWTELTAAIHTGISQYHEYVPCKTVGTKKSLPWITQEIKSFIRKRVSLYQKHKLSGKARDRAAFLKMKHHVQHSICKSNNVYLETILDSTTLTITPAQIVLVSFLPRNFSAS